MKRSPAGLLAALALALLAAPLSADAQPLATLPRIGILSPTSPPSGRSPEFDAFLGGLRDLGWIEGQNIIIGYRYASDQYQRLPDLAAELVALKVDVIFTLRGTLTALAARKATPAIPIVFGWVGDAVGMGLVSSLARPGGNATGLSFMVTEISPKYAELLKEVSPKASRLAFMSSSVNPPGRLAFREFQVAAQTLGAAARFVDAAGPNGIGGAFTDMSRRRADAVWVLNNATTTRHRKAIIDFTGRHRLPAGYAGREFVEAGGLMSYGPNFLDLSRRAATYVDKILKGAKPADLPVEQPTRFELVLNMKTAKALGLTFPPSILIRADQVIE